MYFLIEIMVVMYYPNYNEKIKELKKGAKRGYCRICGNYRKLTIDHIPPKSCGNTNRIHINYGKGIIISQNGLNCKTICEDCNNRLFGANYDKVLVKLYNEILNLNGNIQPQMRFDVDVKGLIRCLLGHFLAINVYDENKPVEEILNCELNDDKYIYGTYRKFVLAETDSLEGNCCYYWYYPYNEIVIIPYFFKADILDLPKEQVLYGTLIKCFPIALYIVDTISSTLEVGCHSINFNENNMILDFKNIIRIDFPEKPSSNEIIGLNMGSSFEVLNKPH
jgi:hypothetical protein